MAKTRNALKDLRVEKAIKKRKCHHDKKHVINAGDDCLVIKNPDGMGHKNYCKACAAPILDLAEAGTADLKSKLGIL
jgi:hypothetical protein